jgi:hypothetical protein
MCVDVHVGKGAHSIAICLIFAIGGLPRFSESESRVLVKGRGSSGHGGYDIGAVTLAMSKLALSSGRGGHPCLFIELNAVVPKDLLHGWDVFDRV